MRKYLVILLLTFAPMSASAGTGVMFGISFNFNGDLGVSLKLLSSDRQDRFVGVGGVTWFPTGANPIGVDVGLGYNFRNAAVTAGWDIVNGEFQVGAGYVDTKKKRSGRSNGNGLPPPGENGDDGGFLPSPGEEIGI